MSENNFSSSAKQFFPIIGLETHAELKTQSKMFCGCKNDPFHAEKPNSYTCPVCLGMPGALPVANKTAIEWTIQLGLALHCKINLFSKFDRKHYFYPDLPKGYQISQYDLPFCYDGYVETSEGKVRIRRIHLEEDTAKLVHKVVDGQKVSLIDFNRSSVPLIEIVTEPDIKTGTQAKEYGKKLRQLLRYLDIADCDMEQGGMRLEANISLSSKPFDPTDKNFPLPEYKVEVKNINSFRFLEQAITFEIARQTPLLEANQTPIQETRGWDSVANKTFSQRVKEEAEDYRYFPDPDLPPMQFNQAQIDAWQSALPELFEAKVARWEQAFGLEAKLGSALAEDRKTAEWWETVWLAAQTNNLNVSALAKACINKKITVSETDSIDEVLKKFTALTATDDVSESEITTAIQTVLAGNTSAVSSYQAGKVQVIGFLIGQVMRTLGKKLDPKQVQALLLKQLTAL
jgi:aspartyl-tRNA(Asn)/glutamyl-tRNA(Gln) amidotransferase subunit B